MMKLRAMKANLARIAFFLGIVGASLLSFDSEFRNFGYFPFLIATCLTIYVLHDSEMKFRDMSLLHANLIFAVLHVMGIYQFFLK